MATITNNGTTTYTIRGYAYNQLDRTGSFPVLNPNQEPVWTKNLSPSMSTPNHTQGYFCTFSCEDDGSTLIMSALSWAGDVDLSIISPSGTQFCITT